MSGLHSSSQDVFQVFNDSKHTIGDDARSLSSSRITDRRASIASSDEDDDEDEGNGLRNGDVVAFAANGIPYAVRQTAAVHSEHEPSPSTDVFEYVQTSVNEGISIAEPATHLVVIKQGRWLGFRSTAASGKLLQARKRGVSKLCFFNFNFGIFEQWETDDEPSGGGWSTALMRLRNRRLNNFVLTVEVMKVPLSLQYGGSEPNSGLPPPTQTASPEIRSSSKRPQDTPTSDMRQSNVMRSMSGVLIKEWSSFVLKEVRARQEVEGQMAELNLEMESIRTTVREEVTSLVAEWQTELKELIAELHRARKLARIQKGKTITKVMWARRYTRITSTIFESWWDALYFRQQYAELSKRNTRLRLMHLLSAWARRAWDSKRLKHKQRLTTTKNASILLTRCLHGWHQKGILNRRHARLTSFFITKCAEITLKKCLTNWFSWVHDRQSQKLAAEEKAAAFNENLLKGAFFFWCIWWEERCQRREFVFRSLAKISLQLRKVSFCQWTEFRQSMLAARKRVLRFQAAQSRRSMPKCFYNWLRQVDMLRLKEGRMEEFSRKTMQKMLMFCLTKWKVYVFECKTRMVHFVQALRRMKRNFLSMYFFYWSRMIQEQRTDRAASERCVVLLHRRRIRKVLGAWACAGGGDGNAINVEQVILRMRQLHFARAFCGWRSATQTAVHWRGLARIMVKRMLLRMELSAFNRWECFLSNKKQIRRKVNIILKRWTALTLMSAFYGLCSTVVPHMGRA
ncbi:hypothetical protein CYMTET_9405 [Cymbomonas tetramitiformis]|uniref:Sfi1 spindle body domain-containing protein n=1 Tax=Cymbomonas tetramitiformis TaxID=36881 RepID=A0AAE0GRU5_9CHLO|nr:hypothetical protein CYMTET_9405 [Cymbomonas tetramitiformis]